jgi:hypothetical protein
MLVMDAAKKRYIAWFIPTMIAYTLAVLGVTWLFNNQPPSPPLSYVIALIPALPVLGVFAILARYLAEETDEFVRMRQVTGLLIGMGLTLSFCTVWGFLEFYVDVPKIGIFHTVWIFFGGMGLGNAVTAWWYR